MESKLDKDLHPSNLRSSFHLVTSLFLGSVFYIGFSEAESYASTLASDLLYSHGLRTPEFPASLLTSPLGSRCTAPRPALPSGFRCQLSFLGSFLSATGTVLKS